MPTSLVVPIRTVPVLWTTAVPVGSSPFRRFLPADRDKSAIKLQIPWRTNKRFDKVTKNWVSSKAKSQLNLSQMA